MKLGRYEYGYFLIIIELVVAWFPALRLFNNVPKGVSFTFCVIVFFGIINLYFLGFLRYVCEKKINRWIKAHGFTYDVVFLTSKARIRGQYHNRSVLIELMHGGKSQTTWIKYQVENPNRESFTLSRRSFLSLSHLTRNSLFDPHFDDEFRVKPTSLEIFSDASLREGLVNIQDSNNVIDVIKLKKNELFLYYRGLMTEEEKLDGALEAISLIATSLQ